MLDLGFVREHPETIEKMARDRGITLDLAPFREIDTERRKIITETERMKADRNKASEQIARLKRSSTGASGSAAGGDALSEILAQMKEMAEEIKRNDERIGELDEKLRQFMLTIPNIPHASVPVGAGAADNVEVRRWGAPPAFDFAPRPHWEVGEGAGILDFESAAKIAGARFAVYQGAGARLERAIANFFLDVHTREHGYTEILPPFLVNTASLTGVGQLPKFAAEMFHIEGTDLWLTPTSEVELTSLLRDETLDADDLPRKVCAWTACFRAEAGAAGKDTRGPQAPASISEGRDVQVHAARAELRRTRVIGKQRGGAAAEAGPALSRRAAVHGRHGVRIGEDLRHRGVAAVREGVHGDFFMLEHRGVSGAAVGDPL